jgi:hypothetical protein
MTHTQGNSGRAVGLLLTVGVLAGCTASASIDQPAPTTPVTTTASMTATTTNATGSTTTTPAPPATALACGTAPKGLVDRAGMSIAAHPGAITATTYVFAATTDTGDWYVLGLDRAYVHDDGTPALGPNGDHSRSLALTNPARAADGTVAMIPLSVDVSDRTPVSWDHVSWTGDTLAAGQRAAQRAIACLDAQRRA